MARRISISLVAALLLAMFVSLEGFALVSANKVLPLVSPYPSDIQAAVGCRLCEDTVINAAANVLRFQQAQRREQLRLREDDVLGLLEATCNPYVTEGSWMRREHISVDTEYAEEGMVRIVRPHVLEYYAECRESCQTAREVCTAVMDDPAADGLPGLLLRVLKDKPVEENRTRLGEWFYEAGRQSSQLVCDKMDYCTRMAELQYLAWENHGEEMMVIIQDAPKEIDEAAMDAERMMDGMERDGRPKPDLFARDEIRTLQQAVVAGDRELAESLDPKMKALTDEEFDALKEDFAAHLGVEVEPATAAATNDETANSGDL